MKNPIWLLVLAGALLVVFGGGYWLGERTGVIALDDGSSASGVLTDADDGGSPAQSDNLDEETFDDLADTAPGGLEMSDSGYSLQSLTKTLVVNKPTQFAFRLIGPDGSPVTQFERPYGRDVHVLVARRDLSCYSIALPTLGQDGIWRAPLTLPAPGQYRMVVDFTPPNAERAMLLGVDVPAPGDYSLAPVPPPSQPVEVDGYRIVMSGELEGARPSTVRMSITRAGVPVTDLQPHLASYGHLMVLREGDMAFLHVTAEGRPNDGQIQPGPEVGYEVLVPTSGRYGLYFEFRHAGKLHSAAFTAIAR